MLKKRRELRGAIVGMVMGDGSLYRNVLRNGQPCGNYKLDIAHSVKQEKYLRYKRDIVNVLFDYEIPIINKQVRAKKGGKEYPVIKFCTRVHPRLTQIGKNCYIEGKKRITPWVIANMTIEGLAYWWMDDGHLRIRPPYGGEVMLGTYGFPKADVETLQRVILDRFDIEFQLAKNGKMNRKNPEFGWYLRRGISEGHKLLDLLSDYCVPGMEYKFDYSSAWNTNRKFFDLRKNDTALSSSV